MFQIFTLFFCCLVAHGFSDLPAEDFSCNLSQKLLSNNEIKKNLFFSPYGVKISLQMALEGAAGKTFDEMHACLGESMPIFFSEGIDSFQAVALARDYSVRPSYQDELQKSFHASILFVDFLKKKDEACAIINNWLVTATDGRMNQLLSPQDIDSHTKLLLCNAVSFKQPWAQPFNRGKTKKAPFTTDEDREVSVEMMNKEDYFLYAEDSEASYLELDFEASENGPKYGCIIVLPKDQKALEELESGFNLKMFTDWRSSLQSEYVNFFLPKVTLDWKLDLKNELKKLGIEEAFSPRKADFSRLTEKNDLFIGNVIHVARLKLDEKGLAADAATAVSFMMKAVRRPEYTITMRCDHPFLLFVFEKKSQDILFVGRISRPS